MPPINQKANILDKQPRHKKYSISFDVRSKIIALPESKLLLNFFSSGLQAIAVQVLGGIFFYVISIYLPKETFGAINGINAVCLFLVTMVGFGLEQVVTRRIAASDRSDWAATAFLAHAVFGFLITLVVLLGLDFLIRDKHSAARLLPLFFVAQGLIYMGVPLKQFLNAKERFTPYGVIAIISNVIKIAIVVLLQQCHRLSINAIVLILICTAAFELMSLLMYTFTKTTFSFKFHYKAYVKLLKESAAQYVSVIFDMSLSRMDWILVGVIATNVALADYSFAYRAFELARLPVFIIGPIILPRFARLMSANNKPGILQQQQINSLITVELFFAALVFLVLNILWSPVVNFVTNGKYGYSNSLQFLILSLCIPLQFVVNLLWSLAFSAKKYKSASLITIVCAVVNIVLNLILIPQFGGFGAAMAFLVTTTLQGFLYYQLVGKQIMSITLRPLVGFLAALAIYLFVSRINVHFLIQLVIAVILYLLLAVFSKQISRKHVLNVKEFLS